MDNKIITLDTQIEEIIERYPQSVSYFIEKGVSPFSCAGAFPTTLGKFLELKNVHDVEDFITQLNQIIT